MTEDETPSRPISVAELLAKNGTIGSRRSAVAGAAGAATAMP
jgi:hypothetical protein